MLIPSRDPWRFQPQIVPRIAADFREACKFAFLPWNNTFLDIASGSLGVKDGAGFNGTASVCFAGKSLLFTDQNSYSQRLVIPAAAFATGDFAVGLIGSFVGQTTNASIALSNDSGQAGGSNQWRLQPNYNGSSLSSRAFAFQTYGGSFISAGLNSAFVDGQIYAFLGLRRGTTVELWRDGALVASNTGTVQNVSAAETQQIGFAWGISYVNTAGGHRCLAFGLKKTLSQRDAAELSGNPWGLFEDQDSQTILPDVGVSMPILSAPSFAGRVPRVTLTH